MTDEEFMQINGVGRKKMQDYGYQFIKEIISYKKEKPRKKKAKGSTLKLTNDLYNQGMSIDEIAQERQLAATTIFSHLAKLYEDGKEIDMKKFISKEDLATIKKAREELNDPDTLKAYYFYLNEQMDYGTIRLALAIIAKEG